MTRADIRRMPFPDGCFDVVTAMDVVEHIDDDAAAMREIARVLRPGGALLATVPAYKSLWSEHDVALPHYRRYTAHSLRRLIGGAGLSVVKMSYAVSALFPAIWAYRSVNRMIGRMRGAANVTSTNGRIAPPAVAASSGSDHAPQADLVQVPAAINSILLGLQKAEASFVRRSALPFGVTVVAVARKAAACGAAG